MPSSSTNLPLPQYYARTLRALLPIFEDAVPLSDEGTQATLSQALEDLYLVSRMLGSLGVFSDNESADELGERELIFMTAAWVLGEAEGKGGLGGPQDRIAALQRSETAFASFAHILQAYKVPGVDALAAAQAQGSAADPGARREAKIRAYKQEKELRDKISVSVGVNGCGDESHTRIIN
jgi:hypothetical protein